jgi:hypothetical protein
MSNQNSNIPNKAILKYAHMVKPKYEFIIEENNGNKFLVLVVDCPKMDKNSGEFDEEYYKGLVKEKPQNVGIWINDSRWPILNVTKDIEKFFGINLQVGYSFKNYDYLNDIENIIKEAVLKSSRPEVDAEFNADWDHPKIGLVLRNFQMNVNSSNFIYREELQNILGDRIDLSQYRLITTASPKK